MANRTLREALWSSPKFNGIGQTAQLLFIRLITKCDDFGCFDGRPEVIATQCYPLGGPTHDSEDQEEFARALHELHREGLIIRYSNKGRPFIAIPQWGHDYRFKRRFPAPPINVDVRDISFRSKYGKKIDWRNPEGFDQVSILLDLDGRAAVPQPPEWRRLSDYAPVTWIGKEPSVTEASVTAIPPVTTPQSLPAAPPVTGTHLYDLETLNLNNSETLATKTTPTTGPAPVTEAHAPQSLQRTSAATATANGKIRLNPEGGWDGLSEAQRLRWQEMFADLSIPDQLDRAGAWLLAHPAEREAYERDGTCEAFLIRWLLREARPAAH